MFGGLNFIERDGVHYTVLPQGGRRGDFWCSHFWWTFCFDLVQENGASVAFAMFGGLALCLGNMGMQYSLAFVGISLTEVVSASLAVVLGILLYFPKQSHDLEDFSF